jgi:KUP system potassium uptake protein
MPQLTTYLKDVLAQPFTRVPGTTVYLTQFPDLTPPSFVQNVRHNKVLQSAPRTTCLPHHHDRPRSDRDRQSSCPYRTTREGCPPSCGAVRIHGDTRYYPFARCLPGTRTTQGLEVDLDGATFFLSRVNSLATPIPGMALWRERLFIFLSRNSQRASSFFHIPAEQVVEIGVVVEI